MSSSASAWASGTSPDISAGAGTPSSDTPAPPAGKTWSKGRKPRRPGKLAPYVSYLEQRWAETEGRVAVLALHWEITERGFRGSYSTVRDWARRNLPQTARPAPAPPLPSVPEITGWLAATPEH
ncbi:hypothetical protein [Streptomyces sp. NPDC012510]|uniref:hypothetical protein n=1 Tax=Streptomyces sp. NPDC012510 TaxID=3364838 RepID=UPI0036F08646